MIGYLLIVSGICLSLLGVWMIAKAKSIEKEQQSPSTTQPLAALDEKPSEVIPVPSDATFHEDKKGTEFESHIVDLFGFKQHSNFRELLEWQGDKYSNGVYPKSNCNPDLVVRVSVGREESRILGVECKWRNAFVNDTVTWARQEQIERYLKFGKDRGASVFVALGVGGTESCPAELFIVPISRMTEPEVHRSSLLQFKQRSIDGFLYYDKLKDSLFVVPNTGSVKKDSSSSK